MTALALGYGLSFDDLHDREGLARLDAAFVAWLKDANVDVHARLMAARAEPDKLPLKDEFNLLIEVARPLEDFIGALFGVSDEAAALRGRHSRLAPLYDCKRLFVQRYVARALKADAAAALDGDEVTAAVGLQARLADGLEEWELAFALAVRDRLGAEFKVETATPEIEELTRYAAWALHHPEGKKRHRDGPLFKVPHRLDFEHLVPIETERGRWRHAAEAAAALLRHREGFALTDAGIDLDRRARSGPLLHLVPQPGQGQLLERAEGKGRHLQEEPSFGVTLAGCPLDEKISEMHLLKSEGYSIGALAMVVVDNPMVAATGHRICNDCMKACIYQKQEPVDIPQVETRTLKDVLGAALGLRDLRPADALESAEPARVRAEARNRLQGAGGRPGPGRFHAVAPPDERRPHGGRHRRAEDRAAAARDLGRDRRRRPRAFRADPRHRRACARTSTSASWPASAASPNTASPCAGTRTS